MKAIGILLVAASIAMSTASAQAPQTFAGVITDDGCGTKGHAAMQMGPTDADCAKACVDAHGLAFALLVKDKVYGLSDQKAALKFAGQKVTVVGTLDAAKNLIAVKSIAAR